MTNNDALNDLLETDIAPKTEEFAVLEVFSTGLHEVVKAETSRWGTVCIKVRRDALTETGTAAGRKFPAQEYKAFKLIENRARWAPRLIEHAKDNSWMMREWVGHDTVNALRSGHWRKKNILAFWRFMKDVLDFFHGLPDPILMRDIKPQNIAYDDLGYYFIDLSACLPLERARQSSRSPRMGNGSNLNMAPEIVQSDVAELTLASDYFSFASLVYRFLIRTFAWSNSVDGLEASRAQYLAEYETAAQTFDERLEGIGIVAEDRSFLLKCLHPDPAQRPNEFLAPQTPD